MSLAGTTETVDSLLAKIKNAIIVIDNMNSSERYQQHRDMTTTDGETDDNKLDNLCKADATESKRAKGELDDHKATLRQMVDDKKAGDVILKLQHIEEAILSIEVVKRYRIRNDKLQQACENAEKNQSLIAEANVALNEEVRLEAVAGRLTNELKQLIAANPKKAEIQTEGDPLKALLWQRRRTPSNEKQRPGAGFSGAASFPPKHPVAVNHHRKGGLPTSPVSAPPAFSPTATAPTSTAALPPLHPPRPSSKPKQRPNQ